MRETLDDLTAEFVRSVLSYEPETGIFRWRVERPKRKPGEVAGYVNNAGYVRIRIGGVKYSAHRLAWLHYHGVWPVQIIDHINRDRKDNRIANLRDVSYAENMANSTLRERAPHYAFRGVRLTTRGRWEAYTNVRSKYYHFGTFDTAAEAAVVAAERRAILLKAA